LILLILCLLIKFIVGIRKEKNIETYYLVK